MKRTMFEYMKMISSKVNSDPSLFYKELQKGINRSLPYEVEELKVWLEAYTKNKSELLKNRVPMDR